MLSNKEYYAPVLDDKELFEETKNKFDAATSSENPEEASTSEENQGAADEAGGMLSTCMLQSKLSCIIAREQCCVINASA